MTADALEALCYSLREHPNVAEKLGIFSAYASALPVANGIEIGDDTAVIPDGDGFLLFAAEGMMESFIEFDPWFAGYCAVMVNLSDIAAMGGRPTAIVDVIWAHRDSPLAAEIWSGMRAAARAYNVPIVGGHTTRFPSARTPLLAAAVLGKARKIISSFTAKPGHVLLMAVDLRATFRGGNTLFWNASVGAPAERLQADLNLLPELAEAELVTGGKDISNGGVLGTLAMLLATSRCGATVHLDALPMPLDMELERWLLCFPSFGYLLTATPENAEKVCEHFQSRQIACTEIGMIEHGDKLILTAQGHHAIFAQISFPPVAES